jgi:nitroreductase
VVRNKEALQKIAALTPTGAHVARALLAIAVLMDGAKLPEIDGARAVQNMALAAWNMGIGSCWITNFYDDAMKDLLVAPQRMKLVTVMPFGYPNTTRTRRKKVQKNLSDVVHYEKLSEN